MNANHILPFLICARFLSTLKPFIFVIVIEKW